MPNKILYVRKEDEKWWERANELAGKRGTALSVQVSRLLRNWVRSPNGLRQEPETAAELLESIEETLGRLRLLLSQEVAEPSGPAEAQTL